MWMWILLGILVLLIVLLFIPLTTVVKFSWEKDQRGLFLEFIPGMRMLKIEKTWNLQDINDESLSVVEETETGTGKQIKSKESRISSPGLKRLQNFGWIWLWWNSKVARRGFKKIRMQKVVWQTSFSTGDVALTGIVTGMIWAIKGYLVSLTSNRITLEKVNIDVVPGWAERNLQSHFDCIVRTRLVHIIGIGITASWYFMRYQLLAK